MKKILAIAIAMTITGAASAVQYENGGASATVLAGQQQQQQTQSSAIGLEEGAINITIDQSTPEEGSRSLNNTNINYSGEYSIKNVPNVSAPALTTTLTETCMGSTSVGGAGVGFGLSFGTTWRDSACVRRLDARELNSLGYRLGAKERMCDDQLNREALARAGTPCYVDLPVEAKRPEDQVIPVPVPVEEAPALGSNDPFAWQKIGG